MRFHIHFTITGLPSLMDAPGVDQHFASLLSRPVSIESYEHHLQPSEDLHASIIKILFILNLRKQYDSDFIANLPVSVTAFDRYWRLLRSDTLTNVSDIVDCLDGSDLDDLDCEGDGELDQWLSQMREAHIFGKPVEVRRFDRFRVWHGSDVVGWLNDAVWNGTAFVGHWQATTNHAGKRFSAQTSDGRVQPVDLEGPSLVQCELSVDGDIASVTIPGIAATNGG